MRKSRRPSLTNPTSPVFGVVSTAAIGGLSLIDPLKLNDADRQLVRLGTAAVTGCYVAVTVGEHRRRRALFKAAAGSAAALLAWRFADAADSLDSRLEQKLRLAGARHPRRWMAATAAAATFAGFLADRAAARTGRICLPAPAAFHEQVRAIEPGIRDLVQGILRAENITGSGELLAQLDSAEEIHWGEEFASAVHFRVPDSLPLAVPHDQVFPVRARFAGTDGIQLDVLLQVTDGRLDCLIMEAADPEEAGGAAVSGVDWPDPSAVVYVVDGAEGKSAVTAG